MGPEATEVRFGTSGPDGEMACNDTGADTRADDNNILSYTNIKRPAESARARLCVFVCLCVFVGVVPRRRIA